MRRRTRADLIQAARSVATHFETDVVYVVGSQAILLSHDDLPPELHDTPEIDLYPANNRQWETSHPGFEASEEINALFGEYSQFHERYSFYIDGVDEWTAKLPEDWISRAVVGTVAVSSGKIHIIGPEPNDLAVSKLCRLDPKDKLFVSELNGLGHLNLDVVKLRLRSVETDPQRLRVIIQFVDSLAPDDPEPDYSFSL